MSSSRSHERWLRQHLLPMSIDSYRTMSRVGDAPHLPLALRKQAQSAASLIYKVTEELRKHSLPMDPPNG